MYELAPKISLARAAAQETIEALEADNVANARAFVLASYDEVFQTALAEAQRSTWQSCAGVGCQRSESRPRQGTRRLGNSREARHTGNAAGSNSACKARTGAPSPVLAPADAFCTEVSVALLSGQGAITCHRTPFRHAQALKREDLVGGGI